CERRPKGIAPKKPREARPRTLTRGPVSRDESCAEEWIAYHALQFADARPVVGLLQLRVGYSKADGVAQIIFVVFRGVLQQLRIVSAKMPIRSICLGSSIHGRGHDDH